MNLILQIKIFAALERDFLESILIFGLVVLAGFGIITINLLLMLKRKMDLAKAVRTKGRVVQIVSRGRSPRHIALWAPRVVFQTAQNESVDFVPSTGSAAPPYRVGDLVDVYYNPTNPNKAGLVYDTAGILFKVIFIVLGLMMIFGGAVGVFVNVMISGLAATG